MRWRGYGPSHYTWEHICAFVPWIHNRFVGYVRRHKTKLQVSDLEALTWAIEAMGG